MLVSVSTIISLILSQDLLDIEAKLECLCINEAVCGVFFFARIGFTEKNKTTTSASVVQVCK